MITRPGRNDPCHCGSGKKYKKCHLAEDEARAAQERAQSAAMSGPSALWPPDDDGRLPVLSPPPLPALSPEIRAVEARLERFEQARYEDQVSTFEQELAAGALDRETAFGMLDIIHHEVVERQDLDRFRVLVEHLRRYAPDLYEADLIWYHSWLIEDTVAERAYERLPALVAPLAGTAEENIDEVMRLVDLLLFHDQIEPLRDMMARAWPAIEASDDILPLTAAEFATTLTMLHLYRHLDGGGAPTLDDPGLRAALAPLGKLDDETIQRSLDALSGAVLRDWQPDDFLRPWAGEGEDGFDDEAWDEADEDDLDDLDAFEPLGDFDEDDEDEDEDEADAEQLAAIRRVASNLYILLLEWAGALRREHGVPFSRTELVRDALMHYLMDRPADREGRLPLLPDKQSLNQRLAALMSFLSGQYYRAGAVFALAPAYVDSLAARGIVRPDAARRARKEILSLRSHVRRVVDEATHDPALREAITHAGEG